LDLSASERALKKLQPALGDIDLIRLADGVIKIAVARMVSAIKEISIGRGYDPRDFALLAYGGAGPLHAAFIADELDMHTVLVPPGPGNFSALGAILSDIRYDYVRTQLLDTRKTSVEEIDRLFQPLERQGRDELLRDGVPGKDIVLQRSLGMRYIGQSWELDVAIPADVKSVEEMEGLFYRLHEIRYGHATKDATEIVSLRVAAIGRVNKPELPEVAASGTSKPKATRNAFFDGEVHAVPVYDREHLPLAKSLFGPLIIEEGGSVTIVPPGWSCRVGKVGTLVLKKEAA
jgi:N-methylhydantoinase A